MIAYDGGPAFPVGFAPDGSPDGVSCGMTLRDWFAGQALAALLSSPEDANSRSARLNPTMAAGWSYEFADAMLAARERPS